MTDRGFVQLIWEAIRDALAAHGFALGGGLAMRAHGIIDGETQDIDVFRDDPLLTEPEAFNQAESHLTRLLATHHFTVEKLHHQDFARKFEITADSFEVTNAPLTATLDLGRDRFPEGFVTIHGYGNVVNRNDMAGMKMRALWERQAERDFVDYDAMRRSGLWDAAALTNLLRRTGSFMPPNNNRWNQRLAILFADAKDHLDPLLLTDLGIDAIALLERFPRYAEEHAALTR